MREIKLSKDRFFDEAFYTFINFEDAMPKKEWAFDILDPLQRAHYMMWNRELNILKENGWLKEWQTRYNVVDKDLQDKGKLI